jgi:hypothetical protein
MGGWTRSTNTVRFSFWAIEVCWTVSMHHSLGGILGSLQSSGVAVLLSIMVLVSVAMLLPEVWLLMFSIAISFVLSDIILNLIVHVLRKGVREDFWRVSKCYSKGAQPPLDYNATWCA